MTNKAISAQQSAIYVKAGTAPTTPDDPSGYTEIDGVTTFAFGKGQADTLDATNLRSTQKESIAGLAGGQTVQITGQRWPRGTSAGQDILQDADSDADLYFFMELPTGDKATCVAKVAAFNITPGVNAVMTFTADILPRDFTLIDTP